MRRADLMAWLVVVCVTVAAMTVTSREALQRYRDMRSGWSWDLAYYNQWCWAITKGDRQVTVRPIADYAVEGPSVWQTNYLAPLRYAILPFHALWPDPRTLLITHAVLFWLVLPAAYGLVRFETGSVVAGFLSVFLVWLTPLLGPLAANDFRELQLGIPFVVLAAHGVRARSLWRAILGVTGMLSCRQEYALVVATLAIIPPLRPVGVKNRYDWACALWYVGLVWMLVAFFGHLVVVFGWGTPSGYLAQFDRPRASWLETLATSFDLLAIGLGSWVLLALAAPRACLLMLPWLWSISSGRWALRMIGTERWHEVRYTAPLAAAGLVAGLLGGSRLWRFASKFPCPWGWRLAGALVVSADLILARGVLNARFAQVAYPISPIEAGQLWAWIDRVEQDAGVLAHYDVAAPLSSRRFLYSYVMWQNQPSGYPGNLPSGITWVFCRNRDIEPEVLYSQGFVEVHKGPLLHVYRRDRHAAQRTSDMKHVR